MKISNNKTKAMWNIINVRTNKKPTKEKFNIKLKINNKVISDTKQIVNIFNNHFTSIGENRKKLPDGKIPSGRPVIQPTENTMFLNPVTFKKIYKIITTKETYLNNAKP